MGWILQRVLRTVAQGLGRKSCLRQRMGWDWGLEEKCFVFIVCPRLMVLEPWTPTAPTLTRLARPQQLASPIIEDEPRTKSTQRYWDFLKESSILEDSLIPTTTKGILWYSRSAFLILKLLSPFNLKVKYKNWVLQDSHGSHFQFRISPFLF